MPSPVQTNRVVWTLTICTGLSLLGDSTMYAVLPSQYAVLGLLSVHVGWMLSVNRLVRIPLNMVSGWISDHLGGRSPYAIGLAVGACSTLGYGLSTNVWLLLAFRALWGVAWALLVVAALRMILDVTTERSRGRMLGFYTSISFLAGALGAVGGGFLIDRLGFSPAMLILGGLTWLGFVGALTLPCSRTAVRHSTTAGSFRIGWPGLRPKALPGWRHRLDLRILSISTLNFAHRFFFAGVFAGTFGLYLRGIVGEQTTLGPFAVGIASLTSSLLFLQNVGAVLAAPAAGHYSDRVGDRSLVLLLGELLGVGALIGLAAGGSLWSVTVAILLVATVAGVVPPLVMSWMGDLSKAERHGSTVGIFQTMGDVGSGLGPLFAYLLLDLAGIRWVYGISAAALALTIPLILLLRPRARLARA